MRRLADYTLGLIIVLGHLVLLSLEDQKTWRQAPVAR
jgi:hypothetical protein